MCRQPTLSLLLGSTGLSICALCHQQHTHIHRWRSLAVHATHSLCANKLCRPNIWDALAQKLFLLDNPWMTQHNV